MVDFIEPRHTEEFICSEANGYRSREDGIVEATDAMEPGTLLGQRTADDIYVRHDPAATDGSEAVAAILAQPISENITERRTLFVRDGEVTGLHLTYSDAATPADIEAANDALAAFNVIVRASGVQIT